MKTKELIAKLLEIDPSQEMEVVVFGAYGYDMESGYDNATDVNIETFVKWEDPWYDYDIEESWYKEDLPRVKKIIIR